MDLNQFTVNADNCGDINLTCHGCTPSDDVASTHGVLGSLHQLPNPLTLTSLLAAATRHNAKEHSPMLPPRKREGAPL